MAKSYRYIWIDPIIISYTGIMSCVSVLGSVFDGTGHWQHGCARHWARFILRISKARVTVNGLENVPLDRPCLFASTHQSFFDIWVLLAHLPIQFRFAAKESLFRVPFLGWHLRRSGNIPVHRGNPRKALRSIRDAARRIAAGVPVLVFPEGERSSDGTLQPFKNGLFLLATYAGCPVVPIAIQDSRYRLPKHSMRIQPGPLTMTVLPPVEVTGFDARNIAELSDRVRTAMLTVYPDGS
jgi:1-acyl-sn-glycerol-3-phosphate acyltransferase